MGPWGIAALIGILAASTKTGRCYARKALKSSILAGYRAKELTKDFAEKAKDYKDDLIAEVKEENEGQHANGRQSKKKSQLAKH